MSSSPPPPNVLENGKCIRRNIIIAGELCRMGVGEKASYRTEENCVILVKFSENELGTYFIDENSHDNDDYDRVSRGCYLHTTES